MSPPTNGSPITRPERTPTPPSWRTIGGFLTALLAAFLLPEVLLFQSGFYARFLEPEASATGYLENVLYNEIHRAPTGRKEVLVVGNSRIAEGFSAKVANQNSPNDGYWFINFGIPATGDRVWYYLVREVDPHRDRYSAITIPIDDYDDPDDFEDVADRISEMPLLINRVGLADVIPFTLSFTNWKTRIAVLRGLALKSAVYQRDFQQFVEHPIRRLQHIRQFRQYGNQSRDNYGGMPHSVAGLQVDWIHQRITFPPGFSPRQREDYTSMFFSHPPQNGRIRALQMRWLAPLVDFYRFSKTRIILFQAPRSPAPRPNPLGHLPWTTVDELSKRPWVRVVDRHTFENLEKPELFADHVHLNASGRSLFSPKFAEAMKATLR